MNYCFKVNYITSLPKEANAPTLSILGDNQQVFLVEFYAKNSDKYDLILKGTCKTNESLTCHYRQWFTEWLINVYDENNLLVFVDKFEITPDKTIFIKMDAFALGDTIAWIPYVEEFRKKHKCNVLCSTFHNDILIDSYPNILFIPPNTKVSNIYSQYYIGAITDGNIKYCPINVDSNPLQLVASKTLGLNDKEIKPNLVEVVKYNKRPINEKYVTISEFASSNNKEWNVDGGWQCVVDYLTLFGFKVIVISKEKTNLTNVIDKSGEISIIDRMTDLYHAEFHIGVSSGLSWLAWALNTHVVMVGDVTPNFHEFSSNITRINANQLSSINYLPEFQTTIKTLINSLGILISDRYL